MPLWQETAIPVLKLDKTYSEERQSLHTAFTCFSHDSPAYLCLTTLFSVILRLIFLWMERSRLTRLLLLKYLWLLGSLLMIFGAKFGSLATSQSNVLWYRKPAQEWLEALPLGNGRMGAMVFGGVSRERIQLNEETLWGGHPRDTVNPEALKALPEVRRLLFEGKNKEATDLAEKSLMGNPFRVESYQTLGDLSIAMQHGDQAINYRRELDISTGIGKVIYRVGEVTYAREVFLSAPHQALVVHITASRPGAISARIHLNREQEAVCTPYGGDGLHLKGQIGEEGLQFSAYLMAQPYDGQVRHEAEELVVIGASQLTLYLSAGTNFRNRNPEDQANNVQRATQQTYVNLRKRHIQSHQNFQDRVSLDLGTNSQARLPTDERLEAFRAGADDPSLIALYFQYGRYLLHTSSRPGDLPANLQGIWNHLIEAPWGSDYHTNINLQMNYWHAEVTQLSDCHTALFAYMKDCLFESGCHTAKAHYGARGWVVHHLSDIWGFTTPADGVWGIWLLGAAWLCENVWEHYRFTNDNAFLQNTGYPLMREAALFFLDFLTPDAQGRLVTNPSHSPENSFRKPDGTVSMFTYGATMDLQIVRSLFTHCIQAAHILHTDRDFVEQWSSALKRLAPLQISPKTGRLQEWIEDYEEPEPGHRHLSRSMGEGIRAGVVHGSSTFGRVLRSQSRHINISENS
jgi:alpha-L-fucosidase 2